MVFRLTGCLAVMAEVANLPPLILESIFSYLNISDLRTCSLVCKKWYQFLNDENNDVWRFHCIRKLTEQVLKSDILKNVPTYKSKLRALFHNWNLNDCSRNIVVKSGGFTVHRNPPDFTTMFLEQSFKFQL